MTPDRRPKTSVQSASHHARRVVWFCIALLALAVGALGVVLPVLPTTPFVILAAFAFGKSSPRLEAWLLNHKVFGPLIRDWRAYGAIPPRAKTIAIAMMAAAFGLSLLLGVRPLVLGIQAMCLSAAALFIITRPSGPR